MEYTKDLFEKLRPNASVATSGRNFCCIVGGFSIKFFYNLLNSLK